MHIDRTPHRPQAPLELQGELPRVVPQSLYRNEVSDASDLYRMTFDELLTLALRQMAEGRIFIIGFHRVMSGIECGTISLVADHPALDIDQIHEPPAGAYHSRSLIRAVISGVGRVLAKHPDPAVIHPLLPKLEQLALLTDAAEGKIAHLFPARLAGSIRCAHKLLEGYCHRGTDDARLEQCLTEAINALRDDLRDSSILQESIDEIAFRYGELMRANSDDRLFWKLSAISGICGRVCHNLTPEDSIVSNQANWDRQIAHKYDTIHLIGNSYCERRYSRSRDESVETVDLLHAQNREAIAIIQAMLSKTMRDRVVTVETYGSKIGFYAAYLGIFDTLHEIHPVTART